MNKEIGIKIWQRNDRTLRIMKWVSDGQNMRGKDEAYVV